MKKRPVQSTKTENLQSGRKIEYIEPTSEEVHDFAKGIIAKFGEQDTELESNTEIFWGLVGFITVVMRITAKELNRGVEP